MLGLMHTSIPTNMPSANPSDHHTNFKNPKSPYTYNSASNGRIALRPVPLFSPVPITLFHSACAPAIPLFCRRTLAIPNSLTTVPLNLLGSGTITECWPVSARQLATPSAGGVHPMEVADSAAQKQVDSLSTH
jgi:hypothetical protein